MTQEEISAILYRYDIVKLASMGCPSDEYDSEARMIAEGMSKCNSQDELAELAASVFTKQFCTSWNPKTNITRQDSPSYKSDEEKIIKVAAEIWKELGNE